jgi:hypothetical protein
MSTTPLTDALEEHAAFNRSYVNSAFARTLETRLAATEAELEGFRIAHIEWIRSTNIAAAKLQEAVHDRDLLRAELGKAEAELERVKGERKYPNIGPDPLKLPGDEYMKRNSVPAAIHELSKGVSLQQKEVPDQTALVWRADLNRLLMDHTWRTNHLPIIKSQDTELTTLRARVQLAEEMEKALQKIAIWPGCDPYSHSVAWNALAAWSAPSVATPAQGKESAG